MAVKKQVLILDAKYVEEADSIVLLGECEQGRLRHQMHSTAFKFGNKDKKTEMIKTAKMFIGKKIWMVFDPELEGKIKDHVKI